MVDKHSQSFFGQNTGITILSSSKSDPNTYIKCIRKKQDGNWEKPSTGEGKTIKCNLEEIIMILEVLKRNDKEWSSFHSFKASKTQISFKWDDNERKKLKIVLGNYSKVLNFSQVELLRLLLEHILKEKVRFSTVPNSFNKKKERKKPSNNVQKPNQEITNDKTVNIKNIDTKLSKVEGSIKSTTEKALLINFNGNKEIWIPKSTIKSHYKLENDATQTFMIDAWVLRRNDLITN